MTGQRVKENKGIGRFDAGTEDIHFHGKGPTEVVQACAFIVRTRCWECGGRRSSRAKHGSCASSFPTSHDVVRRASGIHVPAKACQAASSGSSPLNNANDLVRNLPRAGEARNRCDRGETNEVSTSNSSKSARCAGSLQRERTSAHARSASYRPALKPAWSQSRPLDSPSIPRMSKRISFGWASIVNNSRAGKRRFL